jgi:peptide/nickel transport system permease protein
VVSRIDWRIILRQPAGAISAAVIVLLLAVAIIGPKLVPGSPDSISENILQPPFGPFGLGTDELGRSVALELFYGLRISLLVGLLAAASASLLGAAVGSVAGYFGRRIDSLAMRISESFQVLPTFILAALIVALIGAGLDRVIAVIALLAWPQTARLMRAQVLRVKQLEFVDAARCLGISEWSIMLREVIPNAFAPVLATATLTIGDAILIEAGLSYLGLSDPTVVTWGRMLNSGQRYLFEAWWLSIFPGLAIFSTVLVFNVLGDVLNKVLNPRSAQ